MCSRLLLSVHAIVLIEYRFSNVNTMATAHTFRPRARLLVLLGEQLIGSPRLALFELVKNAYDADATKVELILSLEEKEPSILVEDDGFGMSFEDIRDIWLVPGADHKLISKVSNLRSRRYGRLPLGEKGLGRFAVHKLGDLIEVVSRKEGLEYESVVRIDWRSLAKNDFLSETQVFIEQRSPIVFTEKSHGTRIWIGDLRQKEWSRGDVRRMYRQVTSICSPFGAPLDFEVNLSVPGRESDIKGIPSYSDILSRAIWHFNFKVSEDGILSWRYVFKNHLKSVNLEGRETSCESTRLLIKTPARDLLGDSSVTKDERIIVDAAYLSGVGPIEGDFYVFDRDKEVLARMPETQLIKLFLDEAGGVRIYRDGMRVYNYGERGDDWLGLDLRRINIPAARISRNIIVGAIHLDQNKSAGLTEKTNREGFSESETLERLKRVVLGAVSIFETERKLDKDRLRRLLNKNTPEPMYSVIEPILDLRRLATEAGVIELLEPSIKKIEFEYKNFQETMLQAGISGLGLAVVFHEVERGVRSLQNGLEKRQNPEDLLNQAKSLTKLFDGFSALLKKNEREPIKASTLVKQARDLALLRFTHHKVQLHCPLLAGDTPDFLIQGSKSLLLGVLSNLLDNAFYWLRVRFPETEGHSPENCRKIFITTYHVADNRYGIAVADNGPGFIDPPAALVQPFLTRKPEGMGLGLYYANLVMELSGGGLVFPESSDIELPEDASGAVIALEFENVEKV